MSDERLRPTGALQAPSLVLVNGRPADRIEILDRGLHYGDGLFETLLIHQGHVCQWDRHRDRLYFSAGNLGIPLPPPDDLIGEIRNAVQDLDDAILKILLTRGIGGRGYRPPSEPDPCRLLLVYPLALEQARLREEGVRVRSCFTPASVNPALAGMKHLNRLDSVLARREWDDPAIAEGLMLDPSGSLVGGTMTNVFVWDGVGLRTPPIDQSGVAGTRRGLALDLARSMGIHCAVESIGPIELERAQGVFLTNAVAGVWPVREIDDHIYPPDGLPWKLLRELWQAGRRPA